MLFWRQPVLSKSIKLLNKQYRDTSHSILEVAYTIRFIENTFLDLFKEGILRGTVHTCVGQELAAISVCSNLASSDVVISNHRGHGHYFAHTLDSLSLIAELMGKVGGASGGIGGSQHLYHKCFMSNGIQGSTVPVAAGVAFSKKITKKDIAVVFIGDGTLGEGAVYEAMNLAGMYGIPLLIVLEDNGIAQTTLTQDTTRGGIRKRAQAFDMEYMYSSTDNPPELFPIAYKAVEFCRIKRKPAFLHIKTQRLNAHSKGDDTRDPELVKQLWETDILTKVFQTPQFQDSKNIIENKINMIVEECKNREPCIYNPSLLNRPNKNKIKFKNYEIFQSDMRVNQGINKALSSILEKDNKALLFGEDIMSPYGGAFKVSAGLSDKFPEQVYASSISELGLVGLANGLALMAFRPYVEIMFGDFSTLIIDQIVNGAVKFEKMYGSNVICPIKIRMPMGAGGGYGPTHSQSLEKLFLTIDGLDVVAPNRLLDPNKLYSEIHTSEKPTLILEHKKEYAEYYDINCTNFNDITISDEKYPTITLTPKLQLPSVVIFTYGNGLIHALDLQMKIFRHEEKFAKVVIFSKLTDLNEQALHKSTIKIEELILMEDGTIRSGWGAEIITRLQEMGVIIRKIKRLGAKSSIIPAAVHLESEVLLSANQYWD